MKTDIENEIEDLAFDFFAENNKSCTYEELLEYALERHKEESHIILKIKDLTNENTKLVA